MKLRRLNALKGKQKIDPCEQQQSCVLFSRIERNPRYFLCHHYKMESGRLLQWPVRAKQQFTFYKDSVFGFDNHYFQ